MKVIIIGLGVFGTNLAVDLSDIGAEVIGVDNRNSVIESIKDRVSTTYLLDTTDENAIALLPLKNVDIVIVTIGDNFGASIRTVALLKKAGIKRLMVRAIDELHEAILQGMDVERILTPEKYAAVNLVNELALNSDTEAFAVDRDHYIVKIPAQSIFIGQSYSELARKDSNGLHLVAATRPVKQKNIIGMASIREILVYPANTDDYVKEDDRLTFFGSIERFRQFYRRLDEE